MSHDTPPYGALEHMGKMCIRDRAGTHVRDKDAVVASMLICEMARDYKARGMDLVDAMDALYRRLGYYRNLTVSLSYPGANGAAQMKTIMERLRAQAPSEVAGLAVEAVVDYASGAPMPVMGATCTSACTTCGQPQTLPPANVFELQLAGGNKLIVRPSGCLLYTSTVVPAAAWGVLHPLFLVARRRAAADHRL